MNKLLILALAVGLGGCEPDTYECFKSPNGGAPCKKNGEWMDPYFKVFHKGDAIPDGFEKAVPKYESRPVVYKFTFGSDVLLVQTKGNNTVYCMNKEDAHTCFQLTISPKDGNLKKPYVVSGTQIVGDNMVWTDEVGDEQRAIFKELTHAQ